MDKINGYFNYLLFNGCGCGFNGIRTHGYPYPLLNQVNYINNLITFNFLSKNPLIASVISYYAPLKESESD